MQSHRCQSHCPHTSAFIYSEQQPQIAVFLPSATQRSVGFLVCCSCVTGQISQLMLLKTFGKLEFERNFVRLRALRSLEHQVLNKRKRPPHSYSYTNDHPQLLSSWQRYSAAILKGSYPETTVIRRTNPLQCANYEAKLICIWIKDVQRQRCVFLCTMLPCTLKAIDGGETTEQVPEWKHRNFWNFWKGKWTEPPTMGVEATEHFSCFFSRSSTGQHDYSAGTERENAWRHWYKMKPDRQYTVAS